MSPDDEVHLWPIPLAEVREGDSAWRGPGRAAWEELAPDERARALRTRDPRARARYVAARSRLRRTLASYLGVEPGAVRLRRGRHGKPELAGDGPRFNLSHSGDVALLAVSATRDVGVDVERVRHDMDVVRLAHRFFTPGEYALVRGAERPPDAFARLWTRKEACVKALGGTLFQGLAAPIAGGGGTRVVVKPGGGGALRVTDLHAPEGFAAAVAVDGARPFLVVWRDHPLR
ncbi:4'-phosphopantetheinyl transferase superfamily protein [Nonomuraea sp. B12E4]|uniref:4'-phosphopantetheinyl transferase family protein n=1 Tax=Nonomuraea sp. B12E4 TaxID=3153564 RepID=UPI00325DD379